MRPKNKLKLAKIRDAVVVLAGRGGLVGLSMNEIARKAGIATGTLYVYFAGKEELLRSVYWEIKQATAAAYFHRLDPTLPLKTRLRTIWMNALSHRREHYDEAVFTTQYYQSGLIGEEGRQETHRLFAALFDVLEEGRRHLILKEIDPILTACFLIAPAVEMAALERSGALTLTPQICETAWQLAWDAIKS